MKRNTANRRNDIMKLIRKEGSVAVDNLVEIFKVSSVTIRKDLDYLKEQKNLLRVHGGAILPYRPPVDANHLEKSSLNIEAKRAIGVKASELVQDGDTILLDAGSTTLELARNLDKKKKLCVMTNSLDIALELMQKENIDHLSMFGGRINPRSHSTVGVDNIPYEQHYRFDKLFLGVDGFDMVSGITTVDEEEAKLNKLMCKMTSEVIAVFDSSKVGKTSFRCIISVSEIDKIITDQDFPISMEKELTTLGIEVIRI